jgi:hypothetical protein
MWRRAVKILGSTLREIGILAIVFVALEACFRESPMLPGSVLAVMGLSLLFIGAGIILEAGE